MYGIEMNSNWNVGRVARIGLWIPIIQIRWLVRSKRTDFFLYISSRPEGFFYRINGKERRKVPIKMNTTDKKKKIIQWNGFQSKNANPLAI